MGSSVTYHLYSSSTSSGAVTATLTVLRDGILRAVVGTLVGTTGAGVGYALCGASHNPGGQVFQNTNDPVRQPILASATWSGSGANATYSYTTPYVTCNRRVKAGDVFGCEQTLGGTAAASLIQRWDFIVEEA